MKYSIADLLYIAASPAPEDGGFSPRVVAAAKSALAMIRTLREALANCEVSMDTAMMYELPHQLPPAYRDSWQASHEGAKLALSQTPQP